MTKVDFYILSHGSREHTACKLAEKAYRLGHRVYVHTHSETEAKRLDDLMWTFRDGSFLPHEQYQPGKTTRSPILIGSAQAPETNSEVLINLAPEVPLFFSRFLRVAELVNSDETSKQQGRERFRFYKDRGYQLDTHNL